MSNNTFLFFTSMDFKHTPLIIFNIGSSDNELHKKIALQAFIGSTISYTSNEQLGESILVIPEDKLVVFSYIFSYTDPNLQQNNIHPSALVLVGQEHDRLQLFRNKSSISTKFRYLSEIIQKTWVYGTELSEGVKRDLVEYLKQVTTEMKNGTNQFLSTIIEEDNIFPPNINFFQEMFGKDFSNIIYTVITGKKLAIFAKDINTATLAVSTIEFFCPHRDLIKKVYVDAYDPDYDLFAGPHSLIGTVPSNIPYIDLTGKKTRNLSENTYFKTLIAKVIDIDLRVARHIIEQEINQLLVEVGQILNEAYIEIKKIEERHSDGSGFKLMIKIFRSKYTSEKLELLLDLMDLHDPRLAQKIKTYLLTA